MRDPSNKTIIALLLVALAITIAGTIVSINKVMELRDNYGLLTSAATSSSTGQTNLTITATTSITNQNNTINFGSGRVNASCNFCAMDSNNTVTNLYTNGSDLTGTTGQCCAGFTAVTDGFLIENTGNVNISVGYTCSGNCTHLLFIGGSRYPGMGGLEIRTVPNSIGVQVGDSLVDTAASCQGGGTYYRDGQWNLTNASSYDQPGSFGKFGNSVYTSLSSFGHWLCGNNTHYPLEATNTRDAAVIDINVTIPADAIGTGVQSSFTLTFNGTSAG